MSNITRHQPQQGLIARNITELEQLGMVCADSGFFQDSRDAAKAMVKIAAGQELGLAPIQAMTGIHVIKNRVTLSANLMAALLRKAGYKWKVVKHDGTVCELQMFDPTGFDLGNTSFSMEDAKRAGLTGSDNWKKYPRNMLFARCISNAARWFAPEVITGCYTPEEMGAGLPEDDILDAQFEEQPQPRHQPDRPQRQRVDNHGTPRPLPYHPASQSRDQHPTTVEMDAANQGEAPPVPPPSNGQHTPAPPTKSYSVEHARKRWHAVCGELNIPDEAQRIILGVESRKELRNPEGAQKMYDMADFLESSEGYAAFNGLKRCASEAELRDRFTRLPKVAQKMLAHFKDHKKASFEVSAS